MGAKTRMNIVIDATLEKNFRGAVFKYKGMKKGNISEAIEEAIENWMANKETLAGFKATSRAR